MAQLRRWPGATTTTLRAPGSRSSGRCPSGTNSLKAEAAAIPRMNGLRMNEIQGFVKAGTLPAVALTDFQQRLEQGVLMGELPLSEEPPLGLWQVEVEWVVLVVGIKVIRKKN